MTAQSHNDDSRPISVLVIEDDVDSLDLYEVLLASIGWRVATAGTAAAALAQLDVVRIDVILSDLGLPDTDGFELLPALRKRAGRRVPAVAISGFGLDYDVRRALDAGYDVHLTKPVRLGALREAVERLLG
jgi:two-component system CheB/CheR fusion protein